MNSRLGVIREPGSLSGVRVLLKLALAKAGCGPSESAALACIRENQLQYLLSYRSSEGQTGSLQ
jgi:hypothetical protein